MFIEQHVGFVAAPKLTVFSTHSDLFLNLSMTLCSLIESQKCLNLGLATGRTFLPFYQTFTSLLLERETSLKGVCTFNLDEYVGVDLNHSDSFHSYMSRHLFSRVPLLNSQCFLPNTQALNLQEESARYESLIAKKGGIDFQLLGLGMNGHIGFNEPGSSFKSMTRVVDLSLETKTQNQEAFQGQPFPSQAITMGLQTISKAKTIKIVVLGSKKASILKKCLEKSDELVPASILLSHSNCEWLLDQEAASLL